MIFFPASCYFDLLLSNLLFGSLNHALSPRHGAFHGLRRERTPLGMVGTCDYSGKSRVSDKEWMVMDRGQQTPDLHEINKF
jgi:hypothetical protein